jgi:pimeloyl-ACP methyl ester carboxylesterase
VDAAAAGALPDGTPVTISGSDTVRVWRTADGAPARARTTPHIRLDRERQRLANKGRAGEAGEGFLRWACRAPDGTSYDAVPATWHEIATTNSAAFLNDVGIGTGEPVGRRQVKAITRLAACSSGEYSASMQLVSRLRRQLPDSATHTVPGAGHAAWSGAPGAFAEVASCPTTQATPA